MTARSILTRALPLLVAGCLTGVACDSGDKGKDTKADAKGDAKSADAKAGDAKEDEAKADDAAADDAAAEGADDGPADDGAAEGEDAAKAEGGDDADAKAESGEGDDGAAKAESGEGDDDDDDDDGDEGDDDDGDKKADDKKADDKKADDKKADDKKADDKKADDKKADDKKADDKAPKLDGKPIYMAKCKSCHGATGKADTKLGEKHKIEDWTVPGWKAKWSQAKVVEIVTNGKSGTKMKAFSDKLSKEEIEAVSAYSRKLGK